MTNPRTPSISWVQLLQALAAREGVEGLGLSSRRVAELLNLAPSAVSQYLSGKRLGRRFLSYSSDPAARAIARTAMEGLVQAHEMGRGPTRVVLEGAAALSELSDAAVGRPTGGPSQPAGPSPAELRQISRWIRQRVRVEQVAVSRCMHLAQRARDELTRAILRQIASDSLRHAEIVASLAPYIDRGVSTAFASGVTRKEVEALIEGEQRAEAEADSAIARSLHGTMAVLIESMEADERKHEGLLRGLLESGFRA